MDLITLDPVSYEVFDLYEDYSSLIWTERYTETGEFQLKTMNIDAAMTALPEWQLVSLMDSDQVMRVEDHQIDEDAQGVETLTITGRAVEGQILEGRYVQEPSDSTGPADIGFDCVGVTGIFVYLLYAMEGIWDDYASSLFDANIKPTDSTINAHTDITRFWKQGDVYTPVHDLLAQMNLGMRSIRPRRQDNTLQSVFWTIGSTPPAMTRTTDANPTYMAFDVYEGRDRSTSSGMLNPVAFNALNGALKGNKYLSSRKNFFTGVTVYESGGPLFYRRYVPGWDPTLNPESRNLNYRMKPVDGGSRGSLTGPQMTTYLHQLANTEILKSMNTISTDFAVQDSPTTPIYNQDYFLGDLVDLNLKHGIRKQGRVTEFIRSKDALGIKQYPTITVTDPT